MDQKGYLRKNKVDEANTQVVVWLLPANLGVELGSIMINILYINRRIYILLNKLLRNYIILNYYTRMDDLADNLDWVRLALLN